VVSAGASQPGVPYRHIWIYPAFAGFAAVALLCGTAWYYGYHPRWPSGSQAWYWAALQPGQSLPLVGTIALWLAALAAFWLPRRRQRLSVSLIVVVVMALNAAALGLFSYLPCRGDVSVVGMLFWVIQLFVGQPPNIYQGLHPALAACTGAPPLGLQLGQIVGLGATLIGAVAVGARLWRQPLERLRLWFARDATVLVGLDDMTLPLLRQLAGSPRRGTLIVIEPDETSPLLDEARATGARVIVGEQPWSRLLRRIIAGLRGCSLSYLYALRSDVAENETVLLEAEKILDRHRPAPERLPQLIVRIDDPRHANSWRGSHGGRIQLGLADALSPAETTACALVDSVLAASAEHLVVCGDGDLTIALLFELDRRAWEWQDLGRPLLPVGLVTLIDPKSADTLREYQAGAPRESEGTFPAVGICPDRWQDQVLPLLDRMTPLARQKTAIVITDSFTEAGMQAAGRAARLHPGTAIYLQATAGDGISGPIFDRLHRFRLGLLAAGKVPEDTWTRIARHWHECHQLETTVPHSAARRPWAELDKFTRQDNMLQVRSILSAVATLGREWVPARMLVPGSFIELTGSEIGQVAEIEHTRWYQRQLERGTSNRLAVPWPELSEDSQQRSGKEVRKQITQLERAGFVPVIPRGGPPEAGSYERTGFVRARQLHTPFRWSIRSGEQMWGNPGDWHVSDDLGHVRTVTDPEFRDSHEEAGNGRWHRVGTFRAWPAREGLVIRTKEGTATARPRDWVLEGPAGERWLVPDEQFRLTYRLAAADGAGDAPGEEPSAAPGRAG
jgi:hypothetical protein